MAKRRLDLSAIYALLFLIVQQVHPNMEVFNQVPEDGKVFLGYEVTRYCSTHLSTYSLAFQYSTRPSQTDDTYETLQGGGTIISTTFTVTEEIRIRCAAVPNSDGPFLYSNYSTIEVVDKPQTSVNISYTIITSHVQISWQLIASLLPLYYNISVIKISTPNEMVYNATTSANNHTFTLNKTGSYTVWVTPMNEVGRGPPRSTTIHYDGRQELLATLLSNMTSKSGNDWTFYFDIKGIDCSNTHRPLVIYNCYSKPNCSTNNIGIYSNHNEMVTSSTNLHENFKYQTHINFNFAGRTFETNMVDTSTHDLQDITIDRSTNTLCLSLVVVPNRTVHYVCLFAKGYNYSIVLNLNDTLKYCINVDKDSSTTRNVTIQGCGGLNKCKDPAVEVQNVQIPENILRNTSLVGEPQETPTSSGSSLINYIFITCLTATVAMLQL